MVCLCGTPKNFIDQERQISFTALTQRKTRGRYENCKHGRRTLWGNSKNAHRHDMGMKYGRLRNKPAYLAAYYYMINIKCLERKRVDTAQTLYPFFFNLFLSLFSLSLSLSLSIFSRSPSLYLCLSFCLSLQYLWVLWVLFPFIMIQPMWNK